MDRRDGAAARRRLDARLLQAAIVGSAGAVYRRRGDHAPAPETLRFRARFFEACMLRCAAMVSPLIKEAARIRRAARQLSNDTAPGAQSGGQAQRSGRGRLAEHALDITRNYVRHTVTDCSVSVLVESSKNIPWKIP
jgi:hypothetical protein